MTKGDHARFVLTLVSRHAKHSRSVFPVDFYSFGSETRKQDIEKRHAKRNPRAGGLGTFLHVSNFSPVDRRGMSILHAVCRSVACLMTSCDCCMEVRQIWRQRIGLQRRGGQGLDQGWFYPCYSCKQYLVVGIHCWVGSMFGTHSVAIGGHEN